MVTGAFRGFGGPQGAFAAETQMNRLAEALGMDPVQIRLRNVLREGSLLSVGTPLPEGVSLDRVIEKCAAAAGWKVEANKKAEAIAYSIQSHPALIEPLPPHIRRGIGFAASFKNVGFSLWCS